MRDFKYIWLIGLGVTLIIVAVPILLFATPEPTVRDDPWASVPSRPVHTDHSALISGPLASGPEVTQKCLQCHEDAAHEVAQTAHWMWKGEPVLLEGRDQPVAIGKANLLNNFCIGVQSNWAGCTRCHAGYGWQDASFDFTDESNVDCLVCHDQSGAYAKSTAGLPAEGVDLVAAARSVGRPTRENCGYCHFNGGGDAGVKHGDLDTSLYFPTDNTDVHMGQYDFQCVDCHRTETHQIAGRSLSVSVESANQINCTDCHNTTLHEDERLNAHVDSVACQTCHVPAGAVRNPTKMEWDWSTAGQDREEDPHEYLKIKGSFVYERDFTPEYAWYNGAADRYLLGVLVLAVGQPTTADRWARLAPGKEALLADRAVQIHPGELLGLMHDDRINLRMLDVRDEADYNRFHILDAQHLPLAELPGAIKGLLLEPGNTVFVVMSNDEAAATEAWKTLVAEAVPNAYILGGGVNGWLDTFGDEALKSANIVSSAPADGLRYSFGSALGARRPAADPNPDVFKLEYESKVVLQTKRGAKSGGCG